MSKNYDFEYVEGTSRPSTTISAENDEEAYKLIKAFLDEVPGRSLVPHTIKMTEFRLVEDPPELQAPYKTPYRERRLN